MVFIVTLRRFIPGEIAVIMPKIYTPPPQLPPTCSPLLRAAIASLLQKVGAYVVDPIVERQLAARVRRIEATLDREQEIRLCGGKR
jgi:hypothetical protein